MAVVLNVDGLVVGELGDEKSTAANVPERIIVLSASEVGADITI